VDPATGRTVYRLSDRGMCPGGASHLYADTTEFSIQGHVVFQCRTQASNLNLYKWVVYDPNLRLLFSDATAAANFPDQGYNIKDVQWSAQRLVLYGTKFNGEVWELDPFNGVSRLVFRFPEAPFDFHIGPGDVMIVRSNDKMRIHFWNGTSLWSKNVGALASQPDQPALTLLGEPHYTWYQKPQRKWDQSGGNEVVFDDNHGHTGHFRGSNGKVYLVRGQEETTASGAVGNLGCNPDGAGWRPKYGLYNAHTGKRELTWGCNLNPHPLLGEENKSHFALVSRAPDYIVSTGRLFATRWRANWAQGTVSKDFDFAATHQGNCGYWGEPRGTAHPDATAVMFTSGMADGTVREITGAIKNCSNGDRDLDVYVALAGGTATSPVLTLSSTSLSFSTVQGGNAPAAQAIQITNTGSGTLTWTASDNSTWLSVSPVSGTTPGTLSVSVSPSGLLAGAYNAAITISSSAAQGSPATVAVALAISSLTGSISSLSFSPNPVFGGNGAVGTVRLSAAAPAGGKVVALSSSSALAKVPASVTVPAGATSGSFTATTSAVPARQQVAITATANGSAQSVLLVDPPAVVRASNVKVIPNPIKSGTTATGTVTLSAPAPSGGSVVTLTSSFGAVQVPASVKVPAGQTSVNFSVTSWKVRNQWTSTITASLNGSVHAILTLQP
jgi:hypothetical protein